MVGQPPLTGLKVLEFAGLAPGKSISIPYPSLTFIRLTRRLSAETRPISRISLTPHSHHLHQLRFTIT